MQPPSLREEETAVGGHGGMRAQNVVKGRDIDTIGMASLYRLLKLTGRQSYLEGISRKAT
jgi:hypothetical protein